MDAIIQTQMYLVFSQLNKQAGNELERWQGPPHIDKDKQDDIVLSFSSLTSVCVFSQDNEDGLFI